MLRTGYRQRRYYRQNDKNKLRPLFPIFFGIGLITSLLQIIGRAAYKLIFLILKSLYRLVWVSLHLGQQFIQIAITSSKTTIQLLKVSSQRLKVLLSCLSLPNLSFILAIGSPFPSMFAKIRRRWRWAAALLFLSVSLIGFSFYLLVLKDLPNPHQLITRDQVVATKIYDRHGNLLYTIYNGQQKRTLVTLNDIPLTFIQATIAIEDKNFWQHPGFSWRGIGRAIERNLFKKSIQGGSTITQQLVKNALLTSERTFTRKVKEVLLAIQVELVFSKEEILQMYFNEIPYGGTAYGVEAAAQTYFGKSVRELNLAEAALLAGLPAAPTKFSPFGANPQLSFLRQQQALQRMVEDGYIGEAQADQARQTKLTFRPPTENIQAPHFVMYVKDLLVEKYGTKRVEQGGLEVITSLDLRLQKLAGEELQQELDKLTNLNVTNGAVLITKPSTGEILAMLGSKDFFDTKNDGNVNVTTSPRQPGSSIKPINYAVALQSGYTPGSLIADSPIAYRLVGSPPYIPVNYDQQFHGPITLRTALGSSYNVPAVKVLASYGVNKMIDMGEAMGITTWKDRARFGLSLTLGSGEVKMTDMAVVYGTLANQGLRVDLHPILQVKDYKGKLLQNFSCDNQFNLLPQAEAAEERLYCNPKPVLSPLIAYQLTDILADNHARTPAFGPNSLLVIPDHQVAVKTGTTNDKRDNWTIGYTRNYAVVVWVGNNDNSPMSAVASGITGASPIWHNIIVELLKDLPPQTFSPPPNLKAIPVCSYNGLLPCAGCPTKVEYFLPGTEPTIHCNLEPTPSPEGKRDQILTGVSTQAP